MNKKVYISLACALAISSNAADLGTISVESSTVNVTNTSPTESSNVNIIDEKTIEIVGSKNIVDILKTIPGMTNIARAGEMVQFRFRGVGNQQYMGEKPGVAIVIDGVPVMSVSGGVRLNLNDIKSIKVIKGSASYLYGDTALSGAVVITTKKIKSKSESTVAVEVGSYGYRNYEIGTTQGTENFNINLNASKRDTDGYWTNGRMWTESINGKLSYYLDETSDLTLGIDISDKYDQGGSRSTVSGITEAQTNPQGVADTSYSQDSGIELNKYFLSYNKDFDQSSLLLTTYKYDDLYEQTSNPQDIDSNPATPNIYVNEGHTDLTQEGIKAEYTMDGDLIASLIGLEIGQKEYLNTSKTLASYSEYNVRSRAIENYYKDEHSSTTSEDDTQAIYGEIKYNISPKFVATINARYNIQDKKYTTNNHDYNGTVWSNSIVTNTKSFKNSAYRIGGSYKLTSNDTLFSNISTGFETPDVSDIVETPGIKDQTSINYEIGVRGNTKNNLSYDASIYQLQNKDIIGPEDGTYGFGSPMANIGDSRHRGIELALKSPQEKVFSYNLAYTYLDAKYTKHLPHTISFQDRSLHTYNIVGNQIPRVSKHTVDLFLNYKLTEQIKFITELYAKSSYYADEMNEVKMDGYEVINFQVRYNTQLSKNKLEVFAKIDNVLDKQYFRAAFLHRDKRGALGIDEEDLSLTVDPGRVFYAGIKYTF
jgi:iron complex outermembrane receptor protein